MFSSYWSGFLLTVWMCRATTTPAMPLDSSGSMRSGQWDQSEWTWRSVSDRGVSSLICCVSGCGNTTVCREVLRRSDSSHSISCYCACNCHVTACYWLKSPKHTKSVCQSCDLCTFMHLHVCILHLLICTCVFTFMQFTCMHLYLWILRLCIFIYAFYSTFMHLHLWILHLCINIYAIYSIHLYLWILHLCIL